MIAINAWLTLKHFFDQNHGQHFFASMQQLPCWPKKSKKPNLEIVSSDAGSDADKRYNNGHHLALKRVLRPH